MPFANRLIPVLLAAVSYGQQREQGFLPPVIQRTPSNPLPGVQLFHVLPKADAPRKAASLEMKLLLLSAEGTDPGLTALRTFLDYQGTPYEVVRPGRGEALPSLSENGRGHYQGIILTTGNLGICDPSCHSSLPPEAWTTLETYARDYQVRIASYYTFPEPRFGMTFTLSRPTSAEAPALAHLTAAAADVFPYLRTDATIPLTNAFVYYAKPTPAAGEETIPLLETSEGMIAAIHKKADGREYLALTVDNNTNLLHSQALTYGLVRWVTHGVFLGFRKAFLTPQVDDFFLPNILFDGTRELCRPGAAAFDPRNPTQSPCSILRIGGRDLDALQRWQQSWREKNQFAKLRVSMAFNGYGANRKQDDLRDAALGYAADFLWINHTYDHRSLDCFASVSGVCRGANHDEGLSELNDNIDFADRTGIDADRTAAVTPMITGLRNPEFLRAAADAGIRYLVADGSRPEGTPAFPNTPIPSLSEPDVLLISRRPTNIFYESAHVDGGREGSEVDEFNFLYGPDGLLKVGGTGNAFFAANQTYEQILNRESDVYLGYFFRGDMSPLMFHQSNLYRYSGDRSLFTDLLQLTLEKWEKLSNLPLISLTQSAIGNMLEQRQEFLNAKVKGVWAPGIGVTIESTGTAKTPVTGICGNENCETYGSDNITYVRVLAGQPVTVN